MECFRHLAQKVLKLVLALLVVLHESGLATFMDQDIESGPRMSLKGVVYRIFMWEP